MLMKHDDIAPMHPGELLREDILPEVAMTKTEIAKALQISRQTLYEIINERQPVTPEMAVKLGKFFGQSPKFWINLQRNFDLAMVEKTVDLSQIPTLETIAEP